MIDRMKEHEFCEHVKSAWAELKSAWGQDDPCYGRPEDAFLAHMSMLIAKLEGKT